MGIGYFCLNTLYVLKKKKQHFYIFKTALNWVKEAFATFLPTLYQNPNEHFLFAGGKAFCIKEYINI